MAFSSKAKEVSLHNAKYHTASDGIQTHLTCSPWELLCWESTKVVEIQSEAHPTLKAVPIVEHANAVLRGPEAERQGCRCHGPKEPCQCVLNPCANPFTAWCASCFEACRDVSGITAFTCTLNGYA